MKITIRTRTLKDGSRSVYLDFYDKGERWVESLNLHLVPDNAPDSRRLNEAVMAKANEIKSKRLLGIEDEADAKADEPMQLPKSVLSEWLDEYIEKIRRNPTLSKSYYDNHKTLVNIVKAYLKHRRRPRLLMSKIDKAFMLGLFDFMEHTYRNTKNPKDPKPLSPRTLHLHQNTLVRIFNEAVKEGAMARNPFYSLDKKQRIGGKTSEREYLDKEELLKLMDAPAVNDTTKRAFMFCCFTGLRYGDVKALTWRDIKEVKDQTVMTVRAMQKTGKSVTVPLNESAKEWLPDRKGTKQGERVFALTCLSTCDRCIKKWAESASITKSVSFHTSRHTFATLTLAAGGDLYTVGKLLGHASINSTQIYADVVMDTKVEAINRMSDFFSAK